MSLNAGSVSSNKLAMLTNMAWLRNNRKDSDQKKKSKSQDNLEPVAEPENAHSESPKNPAEEDNCNPEVSDFAPPKEENASASNAESPQVSMPKSDGVEIPENGDTSESQDSFEATWAASDTEEDSTSLRALVSKARAQEDYFKDSLNQTEGVNRQEGKNIWTDLDLVPAKEDISSAPQAEQRPVVTPEVAQKELPENDEFVELTSSAEKYLKVCEDNEEASPDSNVEMWLNKSSTYFDSPEAKPGENYLGDGHLSHMYYTYVDANMLYVDAEEPIKEDGFEGCPSTNSNISQPTGFKLDDGNMGTFFENYNQYAMMYVRKMQLKAAFSPIHSSLNSGNGVFMGNNSSVNNIYYSAPTGPQPTLWANNCVHSWCCPTCGTTFNRALSPSWMPMQGRAEFPIDKWRRQAMGVQRDNDQSPASLGSSEVVGVEQKPRKSLRGRSNPILKATIEEPKS